MNNQPLDYRINYKIQSEDYISQMKPILSGQDDNTLRMLEEYLWQEDTRFDIHFMDKILDEDFIEFGMSGGIYDRDKIMSTKREQINALLPLPEFKIRALSDDIALITYNSVVKYNEKLCYAHRTSIWSRTNKGWKLTFHQGTPFDNND